jgi:hypothetical protein
MRSHFSADWSDDEVVFVRQGTSVSTAVLGELTLIAGGVGAIWGAATQPSEIAVRVGAAGVLFWIGALLFPFAFIYWRSRARALVLDRDGISIPPNPRQGAMRINWREITSCGIWRLGEKKDATRFVFVTCGSEDEKIFLGSQFEIPHEDLAKLIARRAQLHLKETAPSASTHR